MAHFNDEQIDQMLISSRLKAGFHLMKNIFYQQEVEQNLMKILSLAHEILERKGETFYYSTLVYFFKAANLEPERLIEASRQLSEKGGKIAMTTAEKLRKEGRKEGIQEGMQKGIQEGMQKGKQEGKQETQHQTALKMIEKGADDEFIKECTGLSQETIDKLRKGV